MSELDKIRSLVSDTQARYSTAIGDLIQYSFAVKRENNELQRKVDELETALAVCDVPVKRLTAKVEELTELVASLEEVRAKEYAFKQAKVDELTDAIARLASDEDFVPFLEEETSLSTWGLNEIDARKDYAKAALKQEGE